MRSKSSWIIWMTAVCLLGAGPRPCSSVDLNDVRPVRSTYLHQSTASTPNGGTGYVFLGDLGNAQCTNCLAAPLLQYDLSAIPRTATVDSVTLSFTRSSPTGAGALGVTLRQPNAAWSESSAAWNLVTLGPNLGSATIDTNPSFPSLTDGPLKAIVAAWVADPSSNRGLALLPDSSAASAVSFYSKENAQGTPVRLSVRYFPANGGTVPAPIPPGCASPPSRRPR